MKCLILDIEGTTAPISFVHQVLFPFAKKRISSHLHLQFFSQQEILEIKTELLEDFERKPNSLPKDIDNDKSLQTYFEFLMEKDRKFGPLKKWQGWVWSEGYKEGLIQSQIFPDVPHFLNEAKTRDLKSFVYSSGSLQAQKDIYQYSPFGDLTTMFGGYFDTSVGGKKEVQSYLTISSKVSFPPEECVFFTDILEEGNAAFKAGMAVRILERPGNSILPKHDFLVLKSLSEFFG